MSMLGKQIQELRKQQHMTQEELGKAVGVSTQAVSKWECGGTPDAELLPKIADTFHVSIDRLFGKEKELDQSLSHYVFTKLHDIPSDQKMKEAYRVCYSLMNACCELDDIPEVLQEKENMTFYKKDGMRFIYEMVNDQMIAQMSMMNDFPYFVFIPEPDNGFGSMIASYDEYIELFTFLMQPNCLKVLLTLYQRKKGFTISLLTTICNLKEAETIVIVEEMFKRKWLCKIDVETQNDDLAVYVLNENAAFLPFLIMAKEIMMKTAQGFSIVTREKPILHVKET